MPKPRFQKMEAATCLDLPLFIELIRLRRCELAVSVYRRARREHRETILVSQELESFRSNFKFFLSEDEIMSFPLSLFIQHIVSVHSFRGTLFDKERLKHYLKVLLIKVEKINIKR